MDKDEPTQEELDQIIEEFRQSGAFIPGDGIDMAKKEFASRRFHKFRMNEACDFFKELRELNIQIDSIYDLRTLDQALIEETILRHIVRNYNELTRWKMLCWGLSGDSYTEKATATIIDVYMELEEGFFKDNFAGNLGDRGHKALTPKLVEVVKDSSHGDSRVLLVIALVRFLEIKEMLKIVSPFLREDQKYVAEILEALGNRRVIEARALIAPFCQHEDSYIRQKAKRAVSKIDTRVRRNFKARNKVNRT